MSFKIAGHTMGTPELDVFGALKLFKDIGLDGAEIIVQDGYKSAIPQRCSHEYLEQIKKLSEELLLPIIALTPYYSHFNSMDRIQREEDISGLKSVIDYSVFLGAKYIRIYGGNFAQGEKDIGDQKRKYLISSLLSLGDYAQTKGVYLVVENHFNTMSVSAKQTINLINEINHPNVGILYDQANLTFTGQESWQDALELQFSKVLYTHVKDLIFKSADTTFTSSDVSHPKEEERNVITRIVGEGIIPWSDILQAMQSMGYDGWLSLEYERRWHPLDIPEAKIGMFKSMQCLRKIISNLKR